MLLYQYEVIHIGFARNSIVTTRKLAEYLAKHANTLPERRSDRTRVLKDRAQALAQSERIGAPSIKKKLDEEYGSKNVVSQRTISEWISGSRERLGESPEWTPWMVDQPLTDDVGHLLRLNLIKKSNVFRSLIYKTLKQPTPVLGLSVKEAESAVNLELSLQGLDLFIQMSIVHEYSQRLSFANPVTDDLDLLVATKPWLDGRLYNDQIRQGIAPPVEISALAPLVSASSFHLGNLVQFWAWQVLNVPWREVSESQSADLKEKIVKRYGRLGLIGNTDSTADWKKQLFSWSSLIGSEIKREYSSYMNARGWPNMASVEIDGDETNAPK